MRASLPNSNAPILIVERDPYVEMFISRNLEIRGFTIFQARTLEQALGLLPFCAPRLMILELEQCGLDWRQGLHELSRNTSLKNIAILAFTLMSVWIEELQAVNQNVVATLNKPVTAAVLMHTVRMSLSEQARLR